MLSKLKICNGNTFSSHQPPLANDHYVQTGRFEKLVFPSPAARTFIFQTPASSHTLYIRPRCYSHISFQVVTMVQGNNFYIPISSKLIDPECNKTMCPRCRAESFFSACLKRDITSVKAALFTFFCWTHP